MTETTPALNDPEFLKALLNLLIPPSASRGLPGAGALGLETAVAAGTLIHAVMWVTLTSAGLVVLRFRRTSLEEVDQAVALETPPAGKGRPASRR